MRVRGGKPLYGIRVGILVLDTRFPRIPGDLGHAATFDFPVLYHRVRSASPERVVRGGDPELIKPFTEGAQALEREGAGAITTTCGFLAKFQAELAAAVRVPVFTSSLLLVPLVARMLGPGRAVGLLTIDAGALTAEHLAGAGIAADLPLAIGGLEREGAATFARSIIGDELTLDVEAARAEHRDAARRLVEAHPEVGAIVLECANMPPYRADVQAVTGLPVFDMRDLIRLVHAGLPADFADLAR
jgi:hypothetical protein